MKRRVDRLEAERLGPTEAERERHKRLKMVREGAEQQNERFYRYHLAVERRRAFLEDVGSGGHAAEDLRDENFLYPDDEPPFTITEAGEVFSTRDVKPITRSPQTLGEVWYWERVKEGSFGLIHDEEAQAFYTPGGELALSRDRVDLRHLFDGIRDPEE